MKPIFLRDPEAQAWKIGVNAIERATNPQPQKISDGFHYTANSPMLNNQDEIYAQENEPIQFPAFGPRIVPTGIVCPYHPGDKVAVKETWGVMKHIRPAINNANYFVSSSEELKYYYKADNPKWVTLWHSPIIMPSQAVRHFATITKVEAIERDGAWYWKITMESAS